MQRNIANSFKGDDGSSLAALAYAVTHLGVKHVIVCGALNRNDRLTGILNPHYAGDRKSVV